MFKTHKVAKFSGAIVGVIVAAVAVLLVVLVTWDWDRSRPWLNDKVSRAIERDFQIRGHMSVGWHRERGDPGWRGWMPWPRFTASDVVIKNPAWAQKPEFAQLEQVHFDLNLLPLLRHEIDIPALALVNPTIDLERLTDGRVNWTIKTRSDKKSGWTLNLDQITFAAGTVALADQIQKVNLQAEIRPVGNAVDLGTLLDKSAPKVAAQAAAAPPGYGFGFTVKGTHDKVPLSGSGQFGGVLSLVDASKPFPLQVDVRIGDNHIVTHGTVTDPVHMGALDLQLQLASGSMAHLYEIFGVALPETPPFTTQGHLTGHVQKKHSDFRYEKFSGRVGGSDLAGTLEYVTGGVRPKLSGSIRSEKLLFADLAPVVGANNAKGKIAGTHPEVREIPGHAIPATRFRTERWKKMDADVHFVGKQIIRNAALPVNDVSTHLTMADGVLSMNPLEFGVAGGTLSGNIVLNGSTVPLRGKFSLAARGVRLKKLFPTFEVMQTSFGQINGDADLHAVGNDPAALAATLNGEIKLLMTDGAISNALLEKAGLNVANIVLDKLFGDKIVKINCAAADFIVTDGVLDSKVFALDTTDALINVDGTVNLASEEMKLNVYPHTKGFRVFSLRSPLYVNGTFKHPHVGVQVGPLAARGGAALGLGLLDPFAALIALVVPSTNGISPCPAIIADASKSLRPAPRK